MAPDIVEHLKATA